MKSAKTIVILASILFPALCLVGHSDEQADPVPKLVAPTTSKRITKRLSPIGKVIKPPEDPHKNSTILVEAFMVEVRLSALRSLGVPQISKGSDPVSADNIIELLKDTNNAQVTAGAKLTVSQDYKAKSDSTVRECIPRGTPEKKQTEYVDVGTSFLVEARIESREKILVNLDFSHSGVRASNTDVDCGPPLITMNWSLNVLLDDGRPTIVGATQDVQTAAFLIVTANIKD